jgi:hypothetical protein
MQSIYDKHAANSVLNKEKLKPFPLKSVMRHRLHSYFQYSARTLRTIRKEKEKREK